MARKWHYIRDNRQNQIPQNFLFLDSETKWVKSDGITRHTAYMVWSCFCQLKDPDKVTYTSHWKFHTCNKSFWEYIDGLVHSRERLNIVGSNVLFDLAATQGFVHLPEMGWVHSFDVSAGMRFILKIKQSDRSICFLSSQNWIPYSVETLGDMLGKRKGSVDFETSPYSEIKKYCRRDTEIVRDAVIEFVRFVRQHDLGNFANTVSGQALNAYRHRFMGKNILIHNSDLAYDLERDAYFGGRTEAFYIGKVEYPEVVSLDINSMYPFVMKTKEYPTKYRNFLADPDPEYIFRNLRDRCWIADVTLKTPKPLYAVKRDGYTVFPIGEFRTTICTEGFQYAYDHDHIQEIHRAAEYEKGDLFSEYVKYFYSLKQKYGEDGDKLWYTITKLFMNSLYGKFGQEYDTIIESHAAEDSDMYRRICYNVDTGERFIEQSLFGVYKRIQGKEPSQVTFTAIAAHVTEYARFKLYRHIYNTPGARVLYCDTDSIFVPAEDVHLFDSVLDSEKLGYLDVEKRMKGLFIHGCKDYEYEGCRVLKGVKSDAKEISPGEYFQGCWLSLKGMLREGITDCYPVRDTVKTLKREYKKGVVEDSGSVQPLIY